MNEEIIIELVKEMVDEYCYLTKNGEILIKANREEHVDRIFNREKNIIIKEYEEQGYEVSTEKFTNIYYLKWVLTCKKKEEWEDIRYVYVKHSEEDYCYKVYSSHSPNTSKEKIICFKSLPCEASNFAKGYCEGFIHSYKLLIGCKHDEIRIYNTGKLLGGNYCEYIIQRKKEKENE